MAIEPACRITGVRSEAFLVASHIKPWRECASNEERVDGANGLLLSPSIDRLFDRGFISFSDDGELLMSPVADRSEIAKLGVPTEDVCDVGPFSEKQREYLAYHRDNVFRAP